MLEGTAQIKSSDPDIDPLDTERFASASDYSKGDNITPAKAQLQTIIGCEKQRVGLVVLFHSKACRASTDMLNTAYAKMCGRITKFFFLR